MMTAPEGANRARGLSQGDRDSISGHVRQCPQLLLPPPLLSLPRLLHPAQPWGERWQMELGTR